MKIGTDAYHKWAYWVFIILGIVAGYAAGRLKYQYIYIYSEWLNVLLCVGLFIVIWYLRRLVVNKSRLFEEVSTLNQIKSEQDITLRLLQLFHDNNDLPTLSNAIADTLHRWSGCEAVGVRIREGEDYPYCGVKGFPKAFVENERRLTAVDRDNEVLCDGTGNAVLECMCGNVICGRVDATKPYFTEHGSFWIKSSTDFHKSVSEVDWETTVRGRCLTEGYESVALIPLKLGDDCLGLIQFNDFRKGWLDKNKVALFERLAFRLAIGVSQRITAAALMESESNLRQSQEIARMGSWSWSILSDKIQWSDEMYKIYGLNQRFKPTIEVFRERVITEDLEAVDHLLQEVAAGRIPDKTEHRIRIGGSDQVRHIASTIRAIYNDSGQMIKLIGTVQDVTDQKRSEETLRQQENLLRKIAENIPNSYLSIIEKDFTIGFTSGQEFKKQNLNPQKFIGRPLEEVFGKHAETIKSYYAKTFNGQECAFELFTNDQHQLYRTVPLYSSEGDIHRILAVVENITERKRLEYQLQQAQKMESIGNLAGGIAHDFNNILSPIVGMSELLIEDLDSGAPEHEYARTIFNAGLRAKDIVNQILAFSRRSEHELKAVKIQQVLAEVIKLARSIIPSNIEIVEVIQEQCGMIMADLSQLHQVIMNLITNAYHAVGEDSGRISIQLKERVLSGDGLKKSSLTPGRYAVLTVADTGAGIDPDIIPKIFEPYFTTKTKDRGTGLGLAVVYGIVKECGGDIEIQSDPGRGTTFNIYFPLAATSAGPEPTEMASEGKGGSARILLVDDENAILQLERNVLERLGYQVTPCLKSLDALAIFKKNPQGFDLVITDMTMPHMTGDKFAEELLSIRADIPIVICTGFSERIDHEKGKALGIKGLLMKPITKAEMAEMLQKVLRVSP